MPRGGRKILLWILAHSTVVNFWNQKSSDTALKSSRWEELSYRFCFFIFLFCGFLLRKNHFGVLFRMMGKNDLYYSFGPVIDKNKRKCTIPFDDGYNFNFYPQKEKPRFLSFSGCSGEGAPTERFVLASASHWCVVCWGLIRTIFSQVELFLLPLYW